MVDDVTPVQGTSATPNPEGTAAAKSGAAKATFSATTQISSLNDLKAKAPEVYDAMLKGIAQNIISEMREAQERLKKKMREGEEANNR